MKFTASETKLEARFSEYFRRECKARGLRQIDVSARTHGAMSRTRVSDLWNRKTRWTLDSLFLAAKAFGQNEGEFIQAANKIRL